MLLNTIANEREDILKFFLFINIYVGINAFYYFYNFLIFISISLLRSTKLEGDHWRSSIYICWHKCLLLLFYSFLIFISISLVRNKTNLRCIIGVGRTTYTPVVNALLATKRVPYVYHWPRTIHHQLVRKQCSAPLLSILLNDESWQLIDS